MVTLDTELSKTREKYRQPQVLITVMVLGIFRGNLISICVVCFFGPW